MKFQITLLFVSALMTLSSAQAAPFFGIRPALVARDAVISQILSGRSRSALAATVLDRVVTANLEALESVGEGELAAKWRSGWKRQKSKGLAPRLSAIGDHDPLSPWLVDFYVVASKVLGKNSKYGPILADLNTLNYALPIVFAPRETDRSDYRDHFVPFAGILTYYATTGACLNAATKSGADGVGEKLCPMIGARLEKEMKLRLAPRIADYIFDRARGVQSVLLLSARDFLYRTPEDLDRTL